MKKSLIALAVLSAAGGTAFAQTSLTVYGLVDAGVVHDRDNLSGGGNRTSLDSGIQSGSRLGFRGTEDLGSGLKGIFALEMGVNIDEGTSAQGGAAFGRQAYVGLDSNWGRLTLGRQYTPYYLALSGVADPFAAGLAGRADNLMWNTGTRMNNTIKYVLPDFAGFNAELAYGFGEVEGDNSAGRTYGGSIGYAAGPFAVKLAHHSIENEAADRSRSTLLAGTYDLNLAKVHLGVADNDNMVRTYSARTVSGTDIPAVTITEPDSRDWLAGVSVPFGQSTFLVSYVRKEDRTALNQDAEQWGVGYTYNLSKRTNLYTSYAQISNDNGAQYRVGNAGSAGIGEQQFNLGLRHSF